MSAAGRAREQPIGSEKPADYGTKPFWVKCAKCAHCWIVAYAPFELGAFAKIAKANSKHCPKCGARGAVVAKQHDGILDERTP